MAGLTRVGILFSGRGSNMAALLDGAAKPGFPGQVVAALCNVPDAPGLAVARARGTEAVCVPHERDRQAHEAALDEALRERGVEVLCLAGYMRKLTPWFVGRWAGRMLNIHPSLLPLFPGLDTHARALAAGVKLHGCTVHLVTEEVDAGPILAQAAVPVLPGDDADALAARVLVQEHLLYPAALRQAAGGAVALPSPGAALQNPNSSPLAKAAGAF